MANWNLSHFFGTTRHQASAPPSSLEPFQGVAHELLYGDSGLGRARAVGVTSTGRGEGVTTIVSQLARAAARISEDAVLLIDANVARPAIEQRFGVESEFGLQDVLSGRRDFPHCLQPTSVPKLAVLGPGRPMRGSDVVEWESALSELTATFALVLLDLPPVN